jgi:hypothetical protein
MPQYFSLGAVTLALGHFVEAFGNAVYESLGCGTPAIAARVATHRELLPDDLLDKVHFGDAEAAAQLAAQIIAERRRTPPATLAYLHEYYGVERQVQTYADAIINARRRGPLAYRYRPLDAASRYRLAPWCYRWKSGFYHDFRAEHHRIDPLAGLLDRFGPEWRADQAQSAGVDAGALDRWLRDGYIVPMD